MKTATWCYITVHGARMPFELRGGKKGAGRLIGGTYEAGFVTDGLPMTERCAVLQARAMGQGYAAHYPSVSSSDGKTENLGGAS